MKHPFETWQHIFADLENSGQSLNIQIRRALILAIENGLITPGDQLPSSRQLAVLLGVARNTVTAAYRLLVDEKILVSKKRSGMFVGPRPKKVGFAAREPVHTGHFAPKFAQTPSRYRHFNKPRDWQKHRYPFLYGQFDPTMFPVNDWREAMRATSTVREICVWAGDLIDEDDPDLVEQLRVQVLPRRGIFADPGQIIITIGSQQALSMLVQLFVGASSRVGLEDPGYPDLRNMVRLATHDFTRLRIDREGVVPDAALCGCDLVFVSANRHCPTTGVLSGQRRRDLLQAADDHDLIIVEDDYEADLVLEDGPEGVPLKAQDRAGRVIYVGSFSKALAPGLRIGYIVAAAPVINELRILRRLLMRHPPTNNQRILATFIALGHYHRHLQRIGGILSRRAQALGGAARRHLPDCIIRRDCGAKNFWVKLPDGVDGQALEVSARAHGVLVEAGHVFFASARDGRHFIRLGFTSITENRIERGIEILAGLIPTGSR